MDAPARRPSLPELADRCVQCGLCLPHCPTYRISSVETESPRGRIALIRGLAEGRLSSSGTVDTALDHCLSCGRCEVACPAGVPILELIDRARGEIPRATPRSWRGRLALSLLPRRKRLRLLLATYRRLHPLLPAPLRPLPRPPLRARHECPAKPDAFLASGCVAATYEAPLRSAARRLFAATGWTLADAASGCCGAAARHAGDFATASRLRAAARRKHPSGAPLLTLASGCAADQAASLEGHAPVLDALAALETRAASLIFRPTPITVAVHTPCTRRIAAPDPVFQLLARVPALRVITLPDAGCCGAAGLHHVEFPARAAELRAPLLESAAASGASRLLSSNIGCRLHLSDATALPVQHPLEFLAECLP